MGACARPLGLLIAIGLLAGLGACASSPSSTASVSHQSGLRSHGITHAVKPRIVSSGRHLQCVPYARAESGIQIRGDAHTWWSKASGSYSRSSAPKPGAVLVINGYNSSNRGHLAVVRRVVDRRTIVVDHANWLNKGKIHLSTPVRDVSRGNDWSAVKVWYTPGNTMGSRTYTAKGFILPKHQRVAMR